MEAQTNVPLAAFTSFGVGGPAERLCTAQSAEELQAVLETEINGQVWVLGYGANVLIADAGLPGTTILTRGSAITQQDDLVVADAGVWWDDVVQFAIARELWGLELMSAIPGGVGAAVVGNIAAYGQAVADTLAWVDVYNSGNHTVLRLEPPELKFGYRSSAFQTDAFQGYTILRAAFGLSHEPKKDIVYQSALDIAQEIGSNIATLQGRRDTILETRKRAGSLWDYRNPSAHMHTAGSFFRNPMVDTTTAQKLIAFDESGRTAEQIGKMNQIHGGDSLRVSAAHVLLAAGFHRGQSWGPVRLHPDHILKIENTGGATAQQIYDVAQEIIQTAKTKLAVDLVPEVRFLGTF